MFLILRFFDMILKLFSLCDIFIFSFYFFMYVCKANEANVVITIKICCILFLTALSYFVMMYLLLELELERNFAIRNDQRSLRELKNKNVGLNNEVYIDNQYLFLLKELCKYINHSVFQKI